MKKLAFVTAALTALGIAGAAIGASHSEVNPAVKARQSLMQLYSFNLGTLGAMAKGEMDYNAEVAGAAAANLVALSGTDQTAMWPEGTDSGSIEGTRALPAIWENMGEFEEHSDALSQASMTMADAAGQDVDALRGAMKGVGGACGSCHEEFRKSQN